METDATINIISLRAKRKGISGPGKVFNNLVKGLDQLGRPYVVNRPLNSTRRLWIHDDCKALTKFIRFNTDTLLGPNLVVLPGELPLKYPYPRSFYLMPGLWAADLWRLEGFDQCPLKVWPVGIDTEEFFERTGSSKDAPILVYYKSRAPDQLEFLKRTLDKRHIPYKLITYGAYQEEEYKKLLHQCSFLIWLGRQESQGIALQEAMSVGVPILVLDATSLFEVYPPRLYPFPERLRSFKTTSAPYFDERCGIIINSLTMIEEGLSQMYQRFDKFRPRGYILENLSLKKQASEFCNLFQELEVKSYQPPRPMGLWHRINDLIKSGFGADDLRGQL
jgi:Glycosyl transferases group 1